MLRARSRGFPRIQPPLQGSGGGADFIVGVLPVTDKRKHCMRRYQVRSAATIIGIKVVPRPELRAPCGLSIMLSATRNHSRYVTVCDRTLELRQLTYFVVLAEELHFTRAAERLRIAQPPLSRQVNRLEQELKVRLLRRTKRKVDLTEAGALIMPQAIETLRPCIYQATIPATQRKRHSRSSCQMPFWLQSGICRSP